METKHRVTFALQQNSSTVRSRALKPEPNRRYMVKENPRSLVAVPRVSPVLQRAVWGLRETEQGCRGDCGLFKALSVVCVCMDSSFQINLPVWHTLCLTGEACHPASPVHILILVRRADLPFTPHTAKPLAVFLSSSLTPPSLFHTLSFCHFHLSLSYSLLSLIPFLSFCSLPLSLPSLSPLPPPPSY